MESDEKSLEDRIRIKLGERVKLSPDLELAVQRFQEDAIYSLSIEQNFITC